MDKAKALIQLFKQTPILKGLFPTLIQKVFAVCEAKNLARPYIDRYEDVEYERARFSQLTT